MSSLETFFRLYDTFGDILALHGADGDFYIILIITGDIFTLYDIFCDFCALHGANGDILCNSYHRWRHFLDFMTPLVIFSASWRQWRHFIQLWLSLKTFLRFRVLVEIFVHFMTLRDIFRIFHGTSKENFCNKCNCRRRSVYFVAQYETFCALYDTAGGALHLVWKMETFLL